MSPRGFILVLTLAGALAAWPESHAGRDAPVTGSHPAAVPAGEPVRLASADRALPPIALRGPDTAAAPEAGPTPAALELLCALAFVLYVGLRRVS